MAEMAPKEANKTIKHPKKETGSTIWAFMFSCCFFLKITKVKIDTTAMKIQTN